MKIIQTQSDLADYIEARDEAERRRQNYLWFEIYQTCFKVLWPDRSHVDLVCGIDS